MLRYAPAAGEQAAALGSPREAQHHYWRALRFAGGIAPAARAELLERFADHAYLSDMRSEAVDAIDEAIAIHRRRGDVVKEGDDIRLRARLLACIGRAHEGLATARRGGPGARAGAARSRARPRVQRPRRPVDVADDPRQRSTGAQRRSRSPSEVDDTQALVHALNNVGTTEMLNGDPAGQAKLERSLELARQAHLGADAGRAYINLGCTLT